MNDFDDSFQLLCGSVFLVSFFLSAICFSVPFFLFPFFYVPINLVLITFNNCSFLSNRVPLGPAIYRFSWEKPGTVPGQQEIPLVHCEVPSDKGLWVNEFVSSFFFF